jgi:hypothetical protein
MEAASGPKAAATTQELTALLAEIAQHGPAAARRRWPLGALRNYLREVGRRRRFLKQYGWAVPTEEALNAIRDFVGERHLLEVAAGNGLWSYLLSCSGLQVIATDDYSWGGPGADPNAKAALPSGFAIPMGQFYPVEALDVVNSARKYAECRAMLLCWPPPDRPMAHQALTAFQGERFIYISDRACTADEAFYAELVKHWELHDAIDIPNWLGLHDAVYLYERKNERWQPRNVGRPSNPSLSSR